MDDELKDMTSVLFEQIYTRDGYFNLDFTPGDTPPEKSPGDYPVGRLGSGPRPVGRIGSGIRVSASFQTFA